jgi:hypothetical protein
MISAATVGELEARSIDYILGVRERATTEIRGVIADPAPYGPLSIPTAAGRGSTDLMVEEVIRTGLDAGGKPWRRRYIVCRNEAEAQHDKAEREAILAALEAALRRGDKSLVGNRGYRRFLKLAAGRRFEIDPRRVELDALFDGIYVLRTNTKLTPLQAVLRYRDRWMVKDIFRTAKALLATRPIFHKYGRDHPRPRLLFVPGSDLAQGARGSAGRRRTRLRMGRYRAGPRTVERDRDRAGRQALHPAQHRPWRHCHRAQDPWYRPAAADPLRAAAARPATTPKTPPKTPPPSCQRPIRAR